MMTVIPQRRALNGTTSPVPGFDRFEVSGQSIDLPRVQSATLKTAMILCDGETAVIGGLLEDTDRDSVDNVPMLGDLPIVGMLFQGKSSKKVKEHLLITITPRILKGCDPANCRVAEELAGRPERVQAEWNDLYGHAVQNFPLEPCQPRYTPCSPAAAPQAPAAPMVVAPTR